MLLPVLECWSAHHHRSRGMTRRRTQSRGRSKLPFPNKKEKKCYRCGGVFPHTGECPAKHQKCLRCGKNGHFERVCHTKTERLNVHQVSDDEYVQCFF